MKSGQGERLVAGFARALRREGLAVPTGSAVLLAEALSAVGLEVPERVYWAGRAAVVRRPAEVPGYDRAFASFWVATPRPPDQAEVTETLDVALDTGDDESEQADGEAEPAGDILAVRFSALEVLSERDMAALSPAEWEEAQRLISAMRVSTELRPSRRSRPSRRGRQPDLRNTFRGSVRHGGVPLQRAWRTRVERPRRMLFLLDVSGSMEPYSRALARFAHAAVSSRRAGRVEVFTVGTRLTRITREMSGRDPETALRTVAGAVSDWSGGTRLGDSIGRFNDLWGVRGMARGAVVVICSDGWDRGDPAVMSAEMGRLARVAHRVVWVNPLKATPGYAPLARGMAAALPHVDEFVEGHSVASLTELARRIAGGRTRPVAAPAAIAQEERA